MSSHRCESRSNKDTRKSRTVRLGAVLLAVVGVIAAATSAGFTNDAWFSADASSANVSLEGSADGGKTWQEADGPTTAVAIPEATFANMVAGETRTATVELRNVGSVDLDVAGAVSGRTGTLLSDDTKTTVAITIGVTSR